MRSGHEDSFEGDTVSETEELTEAEATEAASTEVEQPETVAAEATAEGDEASTDVEAPAAEEDPYEAFRKELRIKPGRWYVIHSYAGFEKRVKTNIEARRTNESIPGGDDIYQVEVPMEDVREIKNGEPKIVTRVRIPGYVLVRMNLTEDSWALVRHTPGVTGFVGNAHNPTPLRLDDAYNMLVTTIETPEIAQEKAAQKAKKGKGKAIPTIVDYEIGETLTITDGSFQGLLGTVSEIKPESGKLTVLVSLFERETPVELSFDQITKQI